MNFPLMLVWRCVWKIVDCDGEGWIIGWLESGSSISIHFLNLFLDPFSGPYLSIHYFYKAKFEHSIETDPRKSAKSETQEFQSP